MVTRPYGSWTSPITSDLVVAEAIRLDQVALDGGTIYWTESQPQKQGRSFVYRANPGGEPEAVTPDDRNAYNVRTRVHEYGGGAFAVQDGTVYFSNFADQRLYRQDAGGSPCPITPASTPKRRVAPEAARRSDRTGTARAHGRRERPGIPCGWRSRPGRWAGWSAAGAGAGATRRWRP